jgi:large subunit ribosomal protein L10
MRPEKKGMVDMLTGKLSGSGSFIMAGYRGLKVGDMDELRKALLAEETQLMVVPNRMFMLALKNADYEGLDEYIQGPIAVAFVGKDAVRVAKILYTFSKDHQELSLRGGYLDNVAMDGEQIEQVAKLPSRRDLLARFVGQLNAPLSGLVLVLNGAVRGFVTVLSRMEERAER